MLVILTYQRSGSSLVGDMFNTNPNAFYLFEPLDSLYVAMYGINHGWSIPSDITHHFDGTPRRVPEAEMLGLAEFIRRFLSCDISWLPTETLMHNFWNVHRAHHRNVDDYISCVASRNLTYPVCQNLNPFSCGPRFGMSTDARNADCRHVLWDGRHSSNLSSSASGGGGDRQNMTSANAAYLGCLRDVRARIDASCSGLLQTGCVSRRLRVIKATRASMPTVEALLRQMAPTPGGGQRNWRVLHSLRDPRAVAVSRVRQGDPLTGKFAGSATGKDWTVTEEAIVREARMYCRSTADDVRVRRRLEAAYPGLVASLQYDDVVAEFPRYAAEIYRFMNETIPPETRSWMDGLVNRKLKSTGWRRHMTLATSDRILEECRELCEMIRCHR